MLLKLYKRETSEGKTVCIKSLSDFVRKILEETGYDTFFGIEDDTAEELHELAYEPVRYEEHERYMEYYRKCMTSCAETSFLTVWLESTVLKV